MREQLSREAGARRRRSRTPGARAQAAAAGLTEHVEYRSANRHDVVELLSRPPMCSCCRRRQESFGLAALEAMACDMPVIASRVGGLPEVITTARPASCTSPTISTAWWPVLLRLLTDEVLHRRISRAARAVAVERYCRGADRAAVRSGIRGVVAG